jgi:hypothetical protein
LPVTECLVKDLGAEYKSHIDGRAPLFVAAKNGHPGVVRFLATELGADVNHADKCGCTPLFGAAQNGHLDVVRLLVKDFGADVNQATFCGITTLIAATIRKHEEVVTWLLKNGANAQAIHENFGTAAHVSRSLGAPAEQSAYLEARTHCANPRCSGAGLKKCAKCLEVFFCAKDCQVAAWPAHKADCKRRMKAKASKNLLCFRGHEPEILVLDKFRG